MTSFEHCLSVDERDWAFSLATENNLLIFESRNALNAIFFTAGGEGSLHPCACIRIVLNAEPRRESVRATRADEARIVESHHDHDAIANDPLINSAQRDLSVADLIDRLVCWSKQELRNVLRQQLRRRDDDR